MIPGDASIEERGIRNRKDLPEIIYKLEHKTISLKNAPAQYLGNVLLNIPRLVYTVASSTETSTTLSRRSKEFEDLYSLNVRFEEGSLGIGFFSALPEPLPEEEDAQFIALYKVSKFVGLLPRRDLEYSELKLELEKEIADPGLRITALDCLKQLAPPAGKEAIMKFVNINGSSDIKLHDDVIKRKINRLLKEDMKNHKFVDRGVITRIKDDVPFPYFTVKNYAGKPIKVKMPEARRNEIVDYLFKRTPIRLTGVEVKKKNFKIVELNEIEPSNQIFIDSVDGIKFKEPLEAKLSLDKYEDKSEYWIIGNEEFGTFGVDSTVEKAKGMFIDDIYSQYITYKDLSDDKLTEKAIDLKRRLIDLFENR
jgi:hypothetical protein